MSVGEMEFRYVQSLLLQEAGVELPEGKEYLVRARLLPLARDRDLDGADELIARGRNGDREARDVIIAEMLTKETSFFRDPALWRALGEAVLPDIFSRVPRARLWSAAAATGQEAYSLALLCHERFPDMNVEILATDYANDALAVGEGGEYTQLEVNRGLPAKYLVRSFDRQGLKWRLKPEIRQRVTFRQHNLLHPTVSPPADLILLRNVLIYFESEVRAQVLARMAATLRPGGYLILGSAESIQTSVAGLEPESMGKVVAYRRKDGLS